MHTTVAIVSIIFISASSAQYHGRIQNRADFSSNSTSLSTPSATAELMSQLPLTTVAQQKGKSTFSSSVGINPSSITENKDVAINSLSQVLAKSSSEFATTPESNSSITKASYNSEKVEGKATSPTSESNVTASANISSTVYPPSAPTISTQNITALTSNRTNMSRVASVMSTHENGTRATGRLHNHLHTQNSTCAISYSSDYIGQLMDESDRCGILNHEVQNPDLRGNLYADPCFATWCETVGWVTPSTGSWTTGSKVWWSGIEAKTGSLKGTITDVKFFTDWWTMSMEPSRLAHYAPPCCQKCTVLADTMKLFYWPENSLTTTTSPISMSNERGIVVDENGFTFVSPSLYLAFTALHAADGCGTVGEVRNHITLAFDQTEISTFPLVPEDEDQSQLIYTTCTYTDSDGRTTTDDMGDSTIVDWYWPDAVPITIADVAQNCSTLPGYFWYGDFARMDELGFGMFNHFTNPCLAAANDRAYPCHPRLMMPTRIAEMFPDWASCTQDFYGWYDPPKTLHAGNFLVPTTTQGSVDAPVTPTVDLTTFIAPAPSQTAIPPASTKSPERQSTEDPVVQLPAQTRVNSPAGPSGFSPALTVANENAPSITLVVIGTQISQDPGQEQTPASNDPQSLDPALLTSGATIILGSQTMTVNDPGEMVIGTQTLKIDLDPITIGSSILFMTTNSDGSTVVLAGSGMPDPSTTTIAQVMDPVDPPTIELGSTTLTANVQSQFTIGSQTLSIGSPAITANGTTYIMTTDLAGKTLIVASSLSADDVSMGQVAATATLSVDSERTADVRSTEAKKPIATNGLTEFEGRAASMGLRSGEIWTYIFVGMIFAML